MCVGLETAFAVASFASAAAGQVAAFQGQVAQYRAQEQAYFTNYNNSLTAGRDQFRQIQLRRAQEEQAFSQRDRAALMEGAEKRAAASAAAASSGVSGLSIDNLLADVDRKIEGNRATLAQNWDMTAAQLTAQAEGVNSQIQSHIGQVARPIPPDPTGTMLGIIGSGAKTGLQMYSRIPSFS